MEKKKKKRGRSASIFSFFYEVLHPTVTVLASPALDRVESIHLLGIIQYARALFLRVCVCVCVCAYFSEDPSHSASLRLIHTHTHSHSMKHIHTHNPAKVCTNRLSPNFKLKMREVIS
jgi:hypothetical protein